MSTPPLAMSEQVSIGKKGPEAGDLSERLVLPMFEMKIGPADIAFVLASLDVKPPNESVLYKKLNRTGEAVIEAIKEAMKKNQVLCHQNMVQRGQRPEVIVETDATFNNRPQSGFEAATQSFAAMIDNHRGLVLHCETGNKICLKRDCTHKDCEKNYPSEESISSAEMTLVKRNLDMISTMGVIKINCIVTDASMQLEKQVKNVERRKEEW
jgi:hypothetical protein